MAAAGSIEARRRLVDAHSEIATLVAMWVRPRSISQADAVSIGQQELDRLVAWPTMRSPLQVALIEAISTRMKR